MVVRSEVSLRLRSLLAALGVVLAAFGWGLTTSGQRAATLRLASPGQLSSPHAFLGGDCAACHTPAVGVTRPSCVACHSSSPALLGRQPTRFHAAITTCGSCHVEHRGADVRPITMDHAALLEGGGQPLDCAACHASVDPHRANFGTNCQSCHVTGSWEIARFIHPAASNKSCVECHQAPPSHLMEHFTMVSQRVAKRPEATVTQCFACHQTTAWNDIVGVGWYKHH